MRQPEGKNAKKYWRPWPKSLAGWDQVIGLSVPMGMIYFPIYLFISLSHSRDLCVYCFSHPYAIGECGGAMQGKYRRLASNQGKFFGSFPQLFICSKSMR
mgnify:FL=1